MAALVCLVRMPCYNLAIYRQGMRGMSDSLFCNVPSEIKSFNSGFQVFSLNLKSVS